MTEATLQSKLDEARAARGRWRDDPILYGAIIVLFVFLVGIPVFEGDGPLSQLGYVTNAFTELLSIGLTILVLDERARRRDAHRQRDEDLRRIIREMRSPSVDEGVRAVDEARERGLLSGGLLSGANLRRAQLVGTELGGANLQSVHLGDANLQGAELFQADLRGAVLGAANLRNADLRGANLERANLIIADLSGANLLGCNLRDANLKNAEFDTTTLLPDMRNWTPNTDMTGYTNPDHPDFWQPDWAAMGFGSYDKWFDAGRPSPGGGDNE